MNYFITQENNVPQLSANVGISDLWILNKNMKKLQKLHFCGVGLVSECL